MIARNPDVEVLRPGTLVLLHGHIEAMILSATIRGEDCQNVNYECRWFDGAVSTVDSFAAFEVEPMDEGEMKATVGFQ